MTRKAHVQKMRSSGRKRRAEINQWIRRHRKHDPHLCRNVRRSHNQDAQR